MKVNKNVTFEHNIFNTLCKIMEQNHSKSFSAALNSTLSRTFRQEMIINNLEQKLHKAQSEAQEWKERANNRAKEAQTNGLHDKNDKN